ncbi:MAG: COG1361 S-layer family protein [Methanosarcinaceae archaeon]
MIDTIKNICRIRAGTWSVLAVVMVVSMITIISMTPVVQSKEFIPPTYEYTTNYYDAYGEPDIYASVLGDPEFERGETAQLRIILSNRGVLHGLKADADVGVKKSKHALALKELQYESMRTVAYGLSAHLVSNTEYIDVDSGSSARTLEKLAPGRIPDAPLPFTITIAENAPAGSYVLMLPISYEYKYDVRMTGGKTVRLGIPDLDNATYYRSMNRTLPIVIHVKEDARFGVSDVSGHLVAGSDGTINITYINVGEVVAEDALVHIVVMRPLSTADSVIRLGNMDPGESRTASFVIKADQFALIKDYGVDSEIKYLDKDKEYAISRNMKVDVPMHAPEKKASMTRVSLVAITLVILFMLVNNIRKKQ